MYIRYYYYDFILYLDKSMRVRTVKTAILCRPHITGHRQENYDEYWVILLALHKSSKYLKDATFERRLNVYPTMIGQ